MPNADKVTERRSSSKRQGKQVGGNMKKKQTNQPKRVNLSTNMATQGKNSQLVKNKTFKQTAATLKNLYESLVINQNRANSTIIKRSPVISIAAPTQSPIKKIHKPQDMCQNPEINWKPTTLL